MSDFLNNSVRVYPTKPKIGILDPMNNTFPNTFRFLNISVDVPKHDGEWFLLQRVADLFRVYYLHIVSSNHSNAFFWLTYRRQKHFQRYSQGRAGVSLNSVQEWLLLIFLICLHNQLSSIHSIISTDVWKIWLIKWTVKIDGCSFQQVLRQNLG